MRNTMGRGEAEIRKRGKDQTLESARAATMRLIEQHSDQVMRTARRYAATPEDAEDAYQRAVEIMLVKAPAIPDEELLPWLKTVVKHEAFAMRRQQERFVLGSEDSFDGETGIPSPLPSPSEQAERFERLRLGAEALGQLKPQEARAMKLLAQGYSYKQICEKTGWSYTKVNRCLAEGRQSFTRHVAGIESGAECERLAPKLSAFVDGEAPAAEVALLRRHLKRCRACQAAMREHTLAPAVVGALLPSSVLGDGWLVERAADAVSMCKVKLGAFFRLPGVDTASSGGEFAVAGGTRGLASVGLAKGLAVVCIGGAGAGGAAACLGQLLDTAKPDQAHAAGDRGSPDPRWRDPTGSPDPHLVAERTRRQYRRPLAETPRAHHLGSRRDHEDLISRRTRDRDGADGDPPSPSSSHVSSPASPPSDKKHGPARRPEPSETSEPSQPRCQTRDFQDQRRDEPPERQTPNGTSEVSEQPYGGYRPDDGPRPGGDHYAPPGDGDESSDHYAPPGSPEDNYRPADSDCAVE